MGDPEEPAGGRAGRRTGRRLTISRPAAVGATLRVAVLTVTALMAACGGPAPEVPAPARQTAAGREAAHHMVAAAHPLAVEAGLATLRHGGSAIDAAIAVQMVLGFVEAPETGLGGGGFLLYRDAATGTVEFFDGRETAPAAASPERFLWLGRPAPGWQAVPSGRSVGVPGLVAMLALAHERHGLLPWPMLLEPAIELAERDVPMPERLRRQSRADFSLRLFRDTRQVFTGPAGADQPMLRNPAYAATLRQLAAEGPRAFYEGEIAAGIVTRIAARRPWPGDMTSDDLAAYRARQRTPVCGPYRRWTVCGAPPPSASGVALLQALGMLARFDLAALGPADTNAVHLIAEAQRLAYADRERYLGDPDFVAVPLAELLEPAYVAARSMLIDPRRALEAAPAGDPWTGQPRAGARKESVTAGGTSHFTVVDAAGNVAALTSSIEAPFGSRMMTGGFLLNNQLTDFEFAPGRGAQPHPNAAAAGKRPVSAMAPVIVLDEKGELRLALGARGGPRIIPYVLKTLVAVLDWELEIQEAIALPNFAHLAGRLELEAGTALAGRRAEFAALGHRVRTRQMTSGLHGIERSGTVWRGGADPRLEGIARGD